MGALHAWRPRNLMSAALSIAFNQVAARGKSSDAMFSDSNANSLAGQRSFIRRNFDINHDILWRFEVTALRVGGLQMHLQMDSRGRG